MSGQEITQAVSLLKADPRFPAGALFPTLVLEEPPKTGVVAWKQGRELPRRAFAVVMDRAANRSYEALVDLRDKKVAAWKPLTGVQPMFLVEELTSTPEIVRADPRWQAAMKRRGITDFDAVQIDAWAAGTLGLAPDGPRMARALSFYKGKSSNFYARPIEGVVALINLNAKKVVEVTDAALIPISKDDGAFDEKTVADPKLSAKTLKSVQPQGPDFTVRGHEVSWRRWRFRFSMHPREGLVLHQVGFEDGGRLRPILYRASLSEMVVPYGDPDPLWSWRNAFDVGEYGVGRLASPLEPGVDAPNNSVFFDADFVDDFGKAYIIPRAVALYERDGGLLWKHFTMETEKNESRRGRELVASMIATIGNYDYSLNWIFKEDGAVEVQNELTGMMLAKGVAEGHAGHEASAHAHKVSPRVAAPHHQHFFSYRLDFDVDGAANDVYEMNTAMLPRGPENPHGNAFTMRTTALPSELKARRDLSLSSNRKWLIASASARNALGEPTAYAVVPTGNTVPFIAEDSLVRRRAGFIGHHFWATRYKPDEMSAAGPYPNQSKPGQGLPLWTQDDEPLEGQDVVAWYTLGVTHIPRPEEWPIMPVHRTGFTILPVGFFARNPTLTLPRPR